jgi:hypothetical protein
MNHFAKQLGEFARDERGTVIVETVIVMPVLFWTVLAMFSYWDVYRSVNVIQKAAYTVSDVISRQGKDLPLTSDDMIGYEKLMNYLIDQDQMVEMRVTRLTYLDDTETYEVKWSCSPGGDMPELSNADVNTPDMKKKLPIIGDNDIRILVEANVKYTPIFNVGLPYFGATIQTGNDTLLIGQFIVTRPRLATQIDLDDCV